MAKNRAEKKKSCFVITPIGKPGSDIRKWADTILEHIITPATDACGYDKPVRADQISDSGMITIQIMEYLIKADMVIADLTGPNANVFYELAIRHVARKPFVQIIKHDQENPFDTKDLRTIPVDTDISIASKAIEALKKFIPAAEKLGEKIKTPISTAVDLELMKSSGDSQQAGNAEMIELLYEIRQEVKAVKSSPFTIVGDDSFKIGGLINTVPMGRSSLIPDYTLVDGAAKLNNSFIDPLGPISGSILITDAEKDEEGQS